jgi:1-deoxy-D-xylulose-5-phosphate synthase
MTSVLDRISSPEDVKALSLEERLVLVDEIRTRILSVVSRTGGHLASSLGVVELTVALLSVYDPSVDRIIWDVGHQTYAWKLLTGRSGRFHTIRQAGGISGFPKRSESPYDAFGTGHSSTSISAAVGFAMARDLSGGSGKVVAVIGDGAITGGMALEALNHLGHIRTDALIILNDNEMSISPNVGAISRHLTRIITDHRYNRIKKDVWNALGRLPNLGDRVRKAAHAVSMGLKKTLLNPETIFDGIGVRYIGPVPGHDLAALTGVLQRVSEIPGPVLLHLETKKGKGFEPAEQDATGYHGISASPSRPASRESFTSAFSRTMVELGSEEPSLVAITAAMPDGTGLSEFAERFPRRFMDVGIAEQHAVTLACGLAFGGMKPVVAIYSTFLQRALDQVIHDAALQHAPIVLALDRGGLVGEDGPTHHGAFDISLLLPIPGLRLGAPRSCAMLAGMLREAVVRPDGPTALRYPRGAEPDLDLPAPASVAPGCGGQLLREGSDLLLVGVGVMSAACMEAAVKLEHRGISAAVFDPIWLKPSPGDVIVGLARRCGGKVITVEDGSLEGGFGAHVRGLLEGTGSALLTLGIPDGFQPQAEREELLRDLGLDPGSIACKAERMAAHDA